MRVISTIFSHYVHCLMQEAVNNTTVLFAFPDDSSLTFASLRAEQESLTMYSSKPSQWRQDSICRDSDTGYFASRSGAAAVAEEDVSSSEDEASDDPPGDQVDPPGDQVDPPGDQVDAPGDQVDPPGDQVDAPGDQVDPPGDETDPPTDTDTEEQLPKSTACKAGKGESDDDTASPDNLLTEATVRRDEKPHAEREPLGDPLSKQPSALEAEQHFLAPDQASPAEIVPDSKGREEVSCSGKVESAEEGETEVVNEEQVETDAKKKAEHMFEGKKQAESAGSTEAGNEDKTKEANGKTDASKTKRTSSPALGQSKGVTVGATDLKQGTRADVSLQVQSEHEQISTSSQETDSKKGGAKDTSPPVADKQPDPKALPSNDEPCSKHVGTTDAKKPPIPRVEDTQDVVTVEDECAQAIVEGQQVQMVMAHMELHDYESDLPFPIQESEQGREKAAQLVPPHT